MMLKYKFIVLAFFSSFIRTAYAAIPVNFIDTAPDYFSTECLINTTNCYKSLNSSELQDDKLKAVFLYLNHYNVLVKAYPYEKVLLDLSKLSLLSSEAKKLEALIYYNGFNVAKNLDKSIDILQSIDNFEHDAWVLETLGKMYIAKYVESEKKDSSYPKLIVKYLSNARDMGQMSASRTLAYWLVHYGNEESEEDFSLLLRTLKQLAKAGNQTDIDIYHKFLQAYGDRVNSP